MGMIKNFFNKWVLQKPVDYDYLAHIFIPNVDSLRKQLAVPTVLKRDKDDNLLYLLDSNTKGKVFRELFPGENREMFTEEELGNLKDELKKLQAPVEKSKKSTDIKPIENPLNKKKRIYQLTYLIDKYEQAQGSFVIEDSNGKKNIYYQRKSSGLFPLHWDIKSNKAYSPTETQSKNAFMLWKNKYENLKKNPTAHIEKITATIAAVILVVMVLAGGFGLFKMYTHNQAADDALTAQKYICQQSDIQAQEEINAKNKESAGLMNDFIRNKILDQEKEIEEPVASEIK